MLTGVNELRRLRVAEDWGVIDRIPCKIRLLKTLTPVRGVHEVNGVHREQKTEHWSWCHTRTEVPAQGFEPR